MYRPISIDAIIGLSQQGRKLLMAKDETEQRTILNIEQYATGAPGVGFDGQYASLTGIPASFPPDAHGHAQSDVTGLATALSGKADTTHNHDLAYDVLGSASAALSSALAADFDGTWVSLSGKPTTFAPIIGAGATQACAGNDIRLSDARTPTTHNIITGHSFPGGTTNFLREDGTWGLPAAGAVSWGGISGTLSAQTDLQAALDGKQASGSYSLTSHNHTGVYEAANANIQAHVVSAHAPANAQANADITKAEIEAKLTGVIASHSHSGGSAVIGSARVTADRTTTAATFANITDAAIAIGASETWSFEANLSVGCNNTGGGQWTVTVPAGATVRFQVMGNTTAATSWTSTTITTSGANTVTMCAANAQGRLCKISGVVVNSTNAGNIQIQHRAITAGQTITTNANSYITGRRH